MLKKWKKNLKRSESFHCEAARIPISADGMNENLFPFNISSSLLMFCSSIPPDAATRIV